MVRVHSILPEVIEWTCPLSFLFLPTLCSKNTQNEVLHQGDPVRKRPTRFRKAQTSSAIHSPPTPLLRLIRWGSASATRLRAGAALALSRVHSILPEVIEWTCPLFFFIPPHRKTSNASIRNYGGSSPLNPTTKTPILSGFLLCFYNGILSENCCKYTQNL